MSASDIHVRGESSDVLIAAKDLHGVLDKEQASDEEISFFGSVAHVPTNPASGWP